MKHQCSVSNLLAAVVGVVKWGLVIVAALLAVIGIFMAFIIAFFVVVLHKPVVFHTERFDMALYALSATSIFGLLAYGLWKDWRVTVREAGVLVGKGVALFCLIWYLAWVGTVAPAALDHPSTLFVGIHQPLWVHFALLPAQFCMGAFFLMLAAAACACPWWALKSMCAYGAELRDAKAKKLAAAQAA